MKRFAVGIEKIISGGQTGADRAALDVAIALDIPHAGWIPKDRRGRTSGPYWTRSNTRSLSLSASRS